MKVLSENDVIWLTRHNLDELGRVFVFENEIYRLIKGSKCEYFLELNDSGILKKSVEQGFLIDAEICNDICFGKNDLIIKHKKISHLTLINEWTDKMIYDARLLLASFQQFLISHGFCLMDPHYGNVGFDGCKPVYLDWGSIVPFKQRTAWKAWEQYKACWIVLPEYLNLGDNNSLSEIMYLAHDGGGMSDYEYIECTKWLVGIRKIFAKKRFLFERDMFWYKNIKQKYWIKAIREMLGYTDRLIDKKWVKKYEKIKKRKYICGSNNTTWSDYQDRLVKGDNNEYDVVMDNRFSYYISLIKDLKIRYDFKDSFEIAGNSGVLSQLLIEHGVVENAIVSDYDKNAVEKGYIRCSMNTDISRKIIFMYKNIMSLWELSSNPSDNRLKSDLLIALAVTHHLLLSQKVCIDQLINIFYKYTNKILITEFMPKGLWDSVSNSAPPVPDWYTEEWFLNAVSKKFEILKIEKIEHRVCIVALKRE